MKTRVDIRSRGRRWFWLAVVIFVALMIFYSWLYFASPFSDFWDNFTSNLITVLAALLSAGAATLVCLRYEKTEPPRRVWGLLAFALWLWTIAEIIWGYQNLTIENVPVGWPDVFWVVAYLFLGAALYFQFSLLYRPGKITLQAGLLISLGAMAALLIPSAFLALGLASILKQAFDVGILVNSFYPVGDLAMGVVALILARSFRQGALSYPWIGLIIFAVSDFLFAWLDVSGLYAWSVQQGNFLSAFSDITYILAYLIVAMGCFMQWLIMRYGLIFKKES